MKIFENTRIGSWLDYYNNNLLLKRLTSVLGVDILVKASGFILIPFYLRLMSQEEFGLYNYLLSIIQTFSLVLNLGLYIPQSKLYHTLESKKEKGSLLFTVIITLLIFLVVLCIPVFFFRVDYWIIGALFKSSFSYGPYRSVVLLGLLTTILSFMLTNYFYTSENIRQVKTYNIYRILLINTITLVALYLIPVDKVQTRLITTYITEFALLFFFGYFFIKEVTPHFKGSLMITCLKMGLPIMASAVFGLVINFSDKFFLEKYGTLKDLSNYFLAFSFASIIPLIQASLQNVWIPLFMKEKEIQKNMDKTKKLISKLVLTFLPLSMLIWILFQLLLWTGIIPAKYDQVTYILPLLLITQIVAALVPLYSNYLVYFEKTQMVFFAGLFISTVSLVLGLWLIPVWGVYGAAVTSLVSNLCYFIIYYFLVHFYKNKYSGKAQTKQILL